MTGDELERRLRDAFDARARASVGDSAGPPPPRFVQPGKRSRARLVAPLAAAAVVVGVGVSVLAVQGSLQHHPVASTHSATTQPPTTQRATVAAGTPVHIKMAVADGASYGVGMPVVAYFSRRFATAKSLSAATTVTVNGKAVQAAWYFERSSVTGYPVEGHLRMQTYWPAHSDIRVTLAARGVSGGPGLAFGDTASVTFRTGARTVAVVDDAQHRMLVTQDGKPLGTYPVSLGAASSPTSRGIKVIMDKRNSVCVAAPGRTECGVKYAQQVTYGGEYLHAAPWNAANIKRGVDSSNGCTNLLPTDAQFLYKVLKVGDVVEYPDATGPAMRADAGYGDWNVPWRVWLTGGLIPTS